MNLSPEMSHLILEIRQEVPFDQKGKVKFASEKLASDLTNIYFASSNDSLRAKIKRFLSLSKLEFMDGE